MFCCKSTVTLERSGLGSNTGPNKHPLTSQEEFRSPVQQFDLHTWRGRSHVLTYLLMSTTASAYSNSHSSCS